MKDKRYPDALSQEIIHYPRSVYYKKRSIIYYSSLETEIARSMIAFIVLIPYRIDMCVAVAAQKASRLTWFFDGLGLGELEVVDDLDSERR
jgi:hypothetical protein